MTTTTTTAPSGPWALGDYHRFAKDTVWELGERLVRACAIAPGQRVLDVACGTGNAAIRAALAGADVVASDLTPEHFDAGRREASAQGVTLEWRPADAQDLPFPDASFDAVVSTVGVMFAPDHRAAAREILRVTRPGGTIGVTSFTPEGLGAEFFALFAPYMPPPPEGAQPPVLWGDEDHLRGLFGDAVEWTSLHRHTYVERSGSPDAYVALFKETFGPVVGLYEALRGQPERLAEMDRAFRDFAERCDEGGPDGTAEYPYEVLEAVARRR